MGTGIAPKLFIRPSADISFLQLYSFSTPAEDVKIMTDTTSEQMETSCSSQNAQLPTKARPLTALAWGYRQAPSARSRFFAKLPAEIRTQIYQQAFGDRVFHVNLHICVADCWRIKGESRDAASTQIKELPSNMARCHDRLWWGSACNHPKSGHLENNLCTDINGAHFIIDQTTPSKMTSIGVMGWLLSCRQAYVTKI